jgi:RNA polymerase sigma factor (TIGR02999 family)
MTKASPQEVTQLLLAWNDGDQAALAQLTPLVYEELHRIAHRHMCREHPGHFLQTTALVNEAYLRLIDGTRVQWQNRAHFFAVSARMMRRILVDLARSDRQAKRGGGTRQVSIEEVREVSRERGVDLVALDDSLTALAALDPRKSEITELRFFGGLTVEETAEVLKISPVTVLREWNKAKAWLFRELTRRDGIEA